MYIMLMQYNNVLSCLQFCIVTCYCLGVRIDRVLIYETHMTGSYSPLKRAFQLKLPMKGFEVLIRTYTQLLSSVTYFKKKSGVLNPLYSLALVCSHCQ